MSTMDRFLFFQKDYDSLCRQIERLEADYKRWGKISTDGKVGDWHDNFDYEEAMRQMGALSGQIQELRQILSRAQVVAEECPVSGNTERIVMGCRVTLEDEDGELKKYFVGSYRVLRQDPNVGGYHAVSYVSPIGRAMIGKRVDDEVSIRIKGEKVSYFVLDIE